MAARYAEENGLEDMVFLNERKHLVETLKGTLYLVQNNRMAMMLILLEKIPPTELADLKERAYKIISNPDEY